MQSITGSKATILVADDNELNRELLSVILTSEGYNVISAEDGQIALQAMKNGSVDLVLLDVVMPGMSGFELCQTIKFNPETRFVPVVLVTGLSSVDERIRGIHVGADDFLSKPVNSQQQKMKDCNADAKTKQLAGDERKKFMSDCLKGSAAPK